MPIDRSFCVPEFGVARLDEAGVAVIAVTGELDMATVPTLDVQFSDACRGGRGEPVLLDLSAASFMDSSGVDSVLAGHHALAGMRRRLAVVTEAGGQIDRLLTMTTADRVLSRYPDRVTAVDALQASRQSV